MGKPGARSVLYRLIEAGQLARRALLVPLRERGLEPGDDALLLLLAVAEGVSEQDLMVALGLDRAQLEPRLVRLAERELVERRAAGPTLEPAVRLTGRGDRIRMMLARHWDAVEQELVGDLNRKRRKALRHRLGRFVERLGG